MDREQYNGRAQDIHDNIIYIRGSINKLETNIERLANAVDRMCNILETSKTSTELIISHIQNSLPVRFVVLICLIICVAFVGGGFLKEVFELDLLKVWFS